MKIVFAIFSMVLFSKSYSQVSLPDDLSYPEEALENRIQGRVYIKFTVRPTGEIIDSTVHVLQGLGHGLNKIAIDAVKKAPPLGKNYITNLKKDTLSEYVLPIMFIITSKDWARYYYTKGLKEQHEENHSEAIGWFLKAVSFIDNKASYYFALYHSNIKLDNKKDACKYLKEAKKLSKKYKTEWVEHCK